jgi:hypothetical protein
MDDDAVLGNWFDEQYHHHYYYYLHQYHHCCWHGTEAEEEVDVGSWSVVAYDLQQIERPPWCDDSPWLPPWTKNDCSVAVVVDCRPWVLDTCQRMRSDEHSEEVDDGGGGVVVAMVVWGMYPEGR